MSQQITVNQADLAEILGISKKTLQNRQPALFLAGMPRPLPLFSTPIWRRADIEGWIDQMAASVQETRYSDENAIAQAKTSAAAEKAPVAPAKRGRGRPRNIAQIGGAQ